MNSPFYRVFVGRYEKSTDTKSDVEKLRKFGVTPSVFKHKDGYSILVGSTLKREAAENTMSALIKKGFDAFLEEPSRESRGLPQ